MPERQEELDFDAAAAVHAELDKRIGEQAAAPDDQEDANDCEQEESSQQSDGDEQSDG